ncbi:MAG: sulfite exporter TauE/SafE family protein [Armatimonadetes bacterium]|nr:sulfite exporter TauE/SafE family protein [Armatimonadota bacterium]MCX7968878.1 sulfite exporter TauE/SafE family protein [Armatimonadota bacterium]MDW8143652.1 sulfite exporter TauE/SafE family protein [Armatimonadota bacterium]
MQFLASSFIGLLAGLLGGLVGLGGGVLMVPLMVELLKFRQHQAHGTSLVAIVFTGLSGAVAYGFERSVDFVAAIALACTAILTARLGAKFTAVLPEWKLKRSFGAFLLFVALLLALKPYFPHFHFSTTLAGKVFVLLIAGAFTGFLSGMMGVGGGLIMVPVMVLVVGLNQHTAQGTSLLVMVPTGAVGAWTHWKLGHVDWKIAPGLIFGVLIGTSLGARFAHLLPENHLRLIFVAFMVVMSVRYLLTKSPNQQKA